MAESQSFYKHVISNDYLLPITSLVLQPNIAIALTSNNVVDDGEADAEAKAKKIALGSRHSNNVRASCLDIKEPKAEAKDTGMQAHMAAILESYKRRWSERTKHNLGVIFFLSFFLFCCFHRL